MDIKSERPLAKVDIDALLWVWGNCGPQCQRVVSEEIQRRMGAINGEISVANYKLRRLLEVESVIKGLT